MTTVPSLNVSKLNNIQKDLSSPSFTSSGLIIQNGNNIKVSRIANHAITNAFQNQKKAEAATPCQNCPDGLLRVANCYCNKCGGFFCPTCDTAVHSINIFIRHDRDYDTKNFASYSTNGIMSKLNVPSRNAGKGNAHDDNNSVAGLSEINGDNEDLELKKKNRETLRSLLRIRASLMAKIVSMQKTLGLVDNTRSKFDINREKLQELRMFVLQALRDNLYSLNITLSDRIALLSAAAQEMADRQVNIDSLHLQRVQRGQLVNNRLIEMTVFLLARDQVNVLQVEELEQILAYLNRFSVARVTDIPYARGGFQFIEIPDELLQDVLAQTMFLTDSEENDSFNNGEALLSSKPVQAEVYEICKLYGKVPALLPREIGNADAGYYYFAIRIVESSVLTPWLRLGFIEKSSTPVDLLRLGDIGTNSFGFEASNGELDLYASTSKLSYQVRMMQRIDQAHVAPRQFTVGSVVGVLFCPLEQTVQLYHNGEQTEIVHLEKVNFTHEIASYESLNPAICFDKHETKVDLLFARFITDLDVLPSLSGNSTPQ